MSRSLFLGSACSAKHKGFGLCYLVGELSGFLGTPQVLVLTSLLDPEAVGEDGLEDCSD